MKATVTASGAGGGLAATVTATANGAGDGPAAIATATASGAGGGPAAGLGDAAAVIASGRPTQDLQAWQAHNSHVSRTLSTFQNRLGTDEQKEGLAIGRGSKGSVAGDFDRKGWRTASGAGGGSVAAAVTTASATGGGPVAMVTATASGTGDGPAAAAPKASGAGGGPAAAAATASGAGGGPVAAASTASGAGGGPAAGLGEAAVVITSGRPTQDLQARQAHNSSASRTLSSFQNRLGTDEQMEGLAIRRGSKGPATGASDREGRPFMHTAGGGPLVASGARMIDAAPVGGVASRKQQLRRGPGAPYHGPGAASGVTVRQGADMSRRGTESASSGQLVAAADLMDAGGQAASARGSAGDDERARGSGCGSADSETARRGRRERRLRWATGDDDATGDSAEDVAD